MRVLAHLQRTVDVLAAAVGDQDRGRDHLDADGEGSILRGGDVLRGGDDLRGGEARRQDAEKNRAS